MISKVFPGVYSLRCSLTIPLRQKLPNWLLSPSCSVWSAGAYGGENAHGALVESPFWPEYSLCPLMDAVDTYSYTLPGSCLKISLFFRGSVSVKGDHFRNRG